MKLARLLLPTLVACALGTAAPAAAAFSLPLSHQGRWITDASGRVVILHGTNMVYKLAPYYPAAAGFGDDDAAFLDRIGFNAVRVGIIWKALEPRPGVYDDAYLNQIAATVQLLARHGIVSLLDAHQDQYSERFQGEGFPDWAVQDDGLPAQPQAGFSQDYLVMPALERAFDHFWANSPGPGGVGLQDRFAAAWRHVAARFRENPAVAGYEILNEPWPGTQWPTCTLASGCPGFDQGSLTPFYRRVARAIRATDPGTPIWYEPNPVFNGGVQTYAGPLGDPQAGFAFHDYCLIEPATSSPTGCGIPDDVVFSNAVSHVASTGEALMETEFGATDDTGYLSQMVARGDRYMVPWLEWAYCGCHDPTTSGPGDKQAIVRDPTQPPTGSNLVSGTLHALVEPYPQVVAGTPGGWGFDTATKTFTLRYATARAGASGRFPKWSRTEIAAPPLVYGGRYGVRVSGGTVASAPGASVLEIAACPGVATVSVTLTPAGATRGSCRLPGHRRHPAKRHHRPKRHHQAKKRRPAGLRRPHPAAADLRS